MSEPARKPDIREQVGIAVNASALMMSETSETHLERVAALGAATLAVQLGADRHDLPTGAMRGIPANQEDMIEGDLASALWHIRYGGQLDAVPYAVALFATWMSGRGRFSKLTPIERLTLLPKLAARSLHEWLSDRCTACGGSGRQQRTQSGSWVKPMGSMQRNAIFRACNTCHGSKRKTHSDIERMRCLGLSRSQYDQERWGAAVRAGVAWANRIIAARLRAPLTAELERRKRRP